MLSSAYTQVALTYLRRCRSSGIRMLLAIAWGAMLAVGATAMAFSREPLVLLIASFITFIGIVDHVKEQFARWDAQLVPGYRRAHLTIAAVAILFLAVLLPAMAARLAGLQPIGLVAIAVSLLGAVLWCELQFTGLSWMLCSVFFVANASSRSIGQTITEMASGQLDPQAAILFAIGIAMVSVGAFKLLRLDEKMPQPRLSEMFGAGRSAGTQNAAEQMAEGRFGCWVNQWKCPYLDRRMAALADHARRADTSTWSAIRRWQTQGAASWWKLCLLIFAIFFAMQFFLSRSGLHNPTTLATFYLFIMPAAMSTGMWRLRITAMPFEMLLPADRATYLRQMIAALGLLHFQFWAAFVTATIPCVLLAAQPPLPLADLATILLGSALAQVGVFGVSIWLVTHRSQVLFTIVIIVVAGVTGGAGSFAVSSCLSGHPWHAGYKVLIATGLFSIIGIGSIYAAYRRWLVADFD
ncbi:MAG: hypothetical protein LLG00_04100 [Planctomycetaceae bacterium]|nr:hypothetical protein [Planctomycetaceae bacterium]